MQKIHLKPPKNWINDPNGFIWYKGEYHLFYQHFPYEPRWGTMHWGHAVSRDLVFWEHKDIALYPSKYNDQNGCHSGSAVEKDGKMYLFYTGVRYRQTDPEDIHHFLSDDIFSSQMVVISDDGIHFDNTRNKTTVIPPLNDPKIGPRNHTRDPKVWRGKEAWYMILGSRTEEGNGKLLIYESKDLIHWTFANDATRGDGWGWMWECPDYYEIGKDKVLVISSMGIMNDGKTDPNQTICTLVDFDEKSCTMEIPDKYQFLDYGMDLYAPQSTLDEEGRRVFFAWARMPEAVSGSWCGIYTIPRVPEVKHGHIYFRVHPNIQKMFTRIIDKPLDADDAGYRVKTKLEDGEEICIGGYRIFRRGNHICTDRSNVFVNHPDCCMTFQTPELTEGYCLDIYVDANLIEVYVNDGEYVITNVVYNLGDDIKTEHPEKVQIYTLE